MRLLRLALAAAPLYWLGTSLDWAAVGARLLALDLASVTFALSAPLVAMAVAAVRWRVLLASYGGTHLPRVSTLFRYVLVGQYFNMLPGAIAGDALRAFRTRRLLPSSVNSFTVVVAERLCGLVGLLSLGAAALVWSPATPAALGALAAGTLVAAALGTAVFAGPALYRRFVPPAGAWALVDGILRRVSAPASAGGLVTGVMLSLVTQGVTMLQIIVLLADLAPDAHVASVAEVLPALILLTYIPVTPAAVGQRELVFVHVLGTAGVPAESAIGASLLVFAMLAIASALGGLVYAFEHSRPSRDVEGEKVRSSP